jgi:hypothetical protein
MGAWYTVLCGTVLHISFVGFTHSLNLSLCVMFAAVLLDTELPVERLPPDIMLYKYWIQLHETAPAIKNT